MMRYFASSQFDSVTDVLRQLVRTGSLVSRRDALAMLLGLHGLRVGEVCIAQVESLDRFHNTLTVPPFKRGNHRVLALDSTLVDELHYWRLEAGSEQRGIDFLLHTRTGCRIHPSHLRRFARRITSQAFGDAIRFHACRHTFAMRTYEATNDLLLVKQLLGHRSVTSTEVYARASRCLPAELRITL